MIPLLKQGWGSSIKGLYFLILIVELFIQCTLESGNLEYPKGQDGGWCVSGVCADDVYDDEPYIVGDMLIEMIAATQQESHFQIVYQTGEKQV